MMRLPVLNSSKWCQKHGTTPSGVRTWRFRIGKVCLVLLSMEWERAYTLALSRAFERGLHSFTLET